MDVELVAFAVLSLSLILFFCAPERAEPRGARVPTRRDGGPPHPYRRLGRSGG